MYYDFGDGPGGTALLGADGLWAIRSLDWNMILRYQRTGNQVEKIIAIPCTLLAASTLVALL